ncbi:hypothetical protein SLEP1_g17766 [Rubroshorea leprosula]|uniref:CUE domain-containing protein n=1 Tax=Rubroshorea leprosula TaxID=152421 RepID=A0AAV5IYZ1_9ROSI|nr:hypothetical protein SLEP1_g17766 [Rubroshorea leprosula]
MSARVCGKRVGCEELFGSSPKRSRCSSFGASPDRPREFGSGSEDPVSSLLQTFPALDPEFISTVLRDHNNKIEEARESLSVLPSDFMERNKSASSDSAIIGNCVDVPTGGMSNCSQISKHDVRGVNNINQKFDNRSVIDGPQWVDLFVREMMSVTNLDDARGRAAKILEAFERNITANTRAAKELELASLKENLQGLLNNNQILKKAVAIQHQRNLEQEVNEREVCQLKLMLSQYQEQVRNLELSNYALKLHLQRAQESSSLHGQFHPDIY